MQLGHYVNFVYQQQQENNKTINSLGLQSGPQYFTAAIQLSST